MGKVLTAIIAVVAVVAIIYFAPEIIPFLASTLGVSTAIATAIVTTAISIGLSVAFRAIAGGSLPSAKAQVGPPQVFRQTITDSFIVYGKRRVGGLLIFFHAAVSGSDHYRYFVVAAAGHRCQGLVSWMLNDEIVTVDGSNKVTSGKYANAAWLWFVRGTDTDAANATFVSECGGNWTSAHQGKGVAKFYAKFKMTDDVVGAGMPNMTAIIEGKDDIVDPRTGAAGYTRNASLIFFDWMATPREDGGFGAYDDEIPPASWTSAQANVCDETVNGAPRYAFDLVITTGAAPAEVRDVFIANCAGSYTYSGGKHLMRPGHWIPVTANLKEDDLAAAIQVSPFLPSDTAANQVQGTYISPADNYQGMPFTTQSLPAADIRQLDLDLAFITNKDQAERVARIMLKRAAAEKQVVWPMNIAGLSVRALDNVQLDTSRYSLSNYAFSVASWALSADFGVVLSLREENEEIYDDAAPVSASTPPTIVQPTTPLSPLADIQTALRNTFAKSGFTPTAIDAGSSATVKLHGLTTADNFTVDYPGTVADPSIAPIDFTGKAYSTIYYPYGEIDPGVGLGDPSPTFGVTSVYADAINSSAHPYRFYLWRSVTTPAAGGGTTTGGGGGFGGGGGGGAGGGVYP